MTSFTTSGVGGVAMFTPGLAASADGAANISAAAVNRAAGILFLAITSPSASGFGCEA
jgi:hypothetical protein